MYSENETRSVTSNFDETTNDFIFLDGFWICLTPKLRYDWSAAHLLHFAASVTHVRSYLQRLVRPRGVHGAGKIIANRSEV